MKKCFKCGETRPLDDFYRHAMMGDGHLNKCKECTKRDVAKRSAQLATTPEGRDAERARGREKYARLYAGIPRPIIGHTASNRRWRADNPDKRKAHNLVNAAVRDGKLVKPNHCEDCGTGRSLHGHHPDYTKPLSVEWLCPKCHALRHRKSEAA